MCSVQCAMIVGYTLLNTLTYELECEVLRVKSLKRFIVKLIMRYKKEKRKKEKMKDEGMWNV